MPTSDVNKLIAVIGATGRTGRLVIEQALIRGNSVVALARRPEAVHLADPRVRVTRADVLDRDSLHGVFEGCDAVISALGVGTSKDATEVYSKGIANVLAEMGCAETNQLAVVSAAPVGPPEDHPGFEHKALWRLFGATYTDMQRMEAVLTASDATWISIRPPRLLAKPAFGSYRIGLKPPKKGRAIRYPDLATALLDVLDQPQFFRTAPYISN